MPNCDYYAAGTDHKAVLDFLLSSGDSDIYELASRGEQPLRQFRSLADFEEHFSIADWTVGAGDAILLQIYAHGAKGRFSRRIKLNPKHCKGATFRYEAHGWGLIQLYLERPGKGRLPNSHTNHGSPKKSASWGDPLRISTIRLPGTGTASLPSRVLFNQFIQKISVGRIGNRVILPQAAELQKQGFRL